MDGVVHLYTDRGPIGLALAVVKLGMAVAGFVIVGRELFAGQVTPAFWTGLVMAAGGGVFGGADLRHLLDRSPQLTLSAEGLFDHRQARPRLIPWREVEALGYRGGQSTGWSLELLRAGAKPVLVSGTSLAIKPRELVRLIQELAPHVAVDTRFRLWIG